MVLGNKAMNLTVAEPVPLVMHQGGTVRVVGARVSLDSLVYAFREGATAEEIADRFPSVSIGDVYTVIGYYLKHRGEVDEYIARREKEADQLQLEIEAGNSPVGRRARLLARLSVF